MSLMHDDNLPESSESQVYRAVEKLEDEHCYL